MDKAQPSKKDVLLTMVLVYGGEEKVAVLATLRRLREQKISAELIILELAGTFPVELSGDVPILRGEAVFRALSQRARGAYVQWLFPGDLVHVARVAKMLGTLQNFPVVTWGGSLLTFTQYPWFPKSNIKNWMTFLSVEQEKLYRLLLGCGYYLTGGIPGTIFKRELMDSCDWLEAAFLGARFLPLVAWDGVLLRSPAPGLVLKEELCSLREEESADVCLLHQIQWKLLLEARAEDGILSQTLVEWGRENLARHVKQYRSLTMGASVEIQSLYQQVNEGSESLAMEEIRPELVDILAGSVSPLRILVVESHGYLPALREKFPQAELYAVVEDWDIASLPAYEGLDVQWTFLNYLEEPVPYAHEFFDYILSDLMLEQAANPQDIAAGFSQFLKQTGALLTSFRNIRHWAVLKDLMEGHYYNVYTRLFARSEFANLLYASFYKEVKFTPQLRPAPEELKERLLAAGFENEPCLLEEGAAGDLDAEFYLVYAARSMMEMALLKSMYTEEQRANLARILRRIEYGIVQEDACATFWEYYDRYPLFPDYVVQFVREMVYHYADFYQHLEEGSSGRGKEFAEILAARRHWMEGL